MTDNAFDNYFSNLQAISDLSFPKKCSNCGKIYKSTKDFFSHTNEIHTNKSGLKQSYDDDDKPIIELFRNCSCGSTLMDIFSDRRDMSESGLKRRNKFNDVLDFLETKGIDRITGRNELLKVLHGETSEVLSRIKPAK